MEIIKIRKKDDPTGTKRSNAVMYWSNSGGELHYHGERDITEDELPEPLKKFYDQVWSCGYCLPCYLAEAGGKYGVAFCAEYTDEMSQCYHMTREQLFEAACEDAEALDSAAFKDLFASTTVYVLEDVDGDGTSEMTVFFPETDSGDVPDIDFCKIDRRLYNVFRPVESVQKESACYTSDSPTSGKTEDQPSALETFLLQEARFRLGNIFELDNSEITDSLVQKCVNALLNSNPGIVDFDRMDNVISKILSTNK